METWTGRNEDIERGNADRDRIQLRAYEIYQARGRAPGRDQEDWFQAERELLGSATEPALEERPSGTRRSPARARPAVAGTNGTEAVANGVPAAPRVRRVANATD